MFHSEMKCATSTTSIPRMTLAGCFANNNSMADAAQLLARSFPTIAAALGFPAPHRDRMRKSLAVEAIASDHRLHANVVKDDAAQRLARLFPPRAKAVRVTPLPDFVMAPNGMPKTRARSDAMSESLRGIARASKTLQPKSS